MIIIKLLTTNGSWIWTAGIIWWLVRRPLVEKDGSKVKWYR